MRLPVPAGLVLPLLLVACASRVPLTPPAAPQSGIEPAKPRWQPAPAKADGARVPGGWRHVVKPGETGLAIAAAYKVPWRTIASANGIGFDSVIRVGQPLFIPSPAAQAPTGRTTPKPDPEALARSFRLDIDDLVSGSAVATAADTVRPHSPARPSPQPQPASAPPLAWPTDGRVILSGFGPKPGGLVNEGVIIRTVPGSPVRAAAPGTILYVGDAIQSFGLLMLVRHEGGAITAYGHLAEALAEKGQRVDRGAIIARAGRSGAAKEPQLFFQLRLGRKAVDPLPYLRRESLSSAVPKPSG